MANLTCRQPLLKSVANNDTESIHCTSDRFLRGLAYPSQAAESWRDVCVHTLNLSAAYVSSYTPFPLARARRLLINNSWKLMNWWWKSAGRGRDLTEDELTWNQLRSGPEVASLNILCEIFRRKCEGFFFSLRWSEVLSAEMQFQFENTQLRPCPHVWTHQQYFAIISSTSKCISSLSGDVKRTPSQMKKWSLEYFKKPRRVYKTGLLHSTISPHP